MFQLNQVACAYEQKKVFTGLDLEIRQGQYVMLMGENGTGKSSLISLLTASSRKNLVAFFLREGPQRMAEGQTSKTRFL
ncbi:MAG: ATP-binding cassette domain-containing protein [Streptococcus sp.]